MSDERTLFRPQALEAQRQQWLGHVQLVRPLSLSLLTTGVVAVALALIAFLATVAFAHYIDRSRGDSDE